MNIGVKYFKVCTSCKLQFMPDAKARCFKCGRLLTKSYIIPFRRVK